jgi:hypothetical protein
MLIVICVLLVCAIAVVAFFALDTVIVVYFLPLPEGGAPLHTFFLSNSYITPPSPLVTSARVMCLRLNNEVSEGFFIAKFSLILFSVFC